MLSEQLDTALIAAERLLLMSSTRQQPGVVGWCEGVVLALCGAVSEIVNHWRPKSLWRCRNMWLLVAVSQSGWTH